MAKSKFEITLSVGRLHGKCMSLTVLANQTEIYAKTKPMQDQVSLEFECDLPARIEFITADKNVMDTILDDAGQIVQDKYIKIDQLVIDRMPVERWLLESRLFEFVEDSGTRRTTNYFGSNGRASLSIHTRDSFAYFLYLFTTD